MWYGFYLLHFCCFLQFFLIEFCGVFFYFYKKNFESVAGSRGPSGTLSTHEFGRNGLGGDITPPMERWRLPLRQPLPHPWAPI